MYSFQYHRARTAQEAAEHYESCTDPVYLAGGMTLIPTLKQRLASASDLIDLGGIEDLIGITTQQSTVTIGSLSPHSMVAADSTISALSQLAGGIGDPQVRNRGTLGGSIANNDPAADYPAAVVGLGATVHTNQRSIDADSFFTGLFETALEVGEIVTQVEFPIPKRAAYAKFPNPASRYAVVGVFVAETNGGIRVAVTGAGPCVFRSPEMENALASDFSMQSVDAVSLESTDFNSDIHASSEYRSHLVTVMAKRAIAQIV